MAKKKSKKKWIILIVVVVVVALAVVAFINLRNNIAASDKTSYAITQVGTGTIEVKVKGAGAVEPLVDETVYASFSGTVADVMVENGDVVGADDVIVTFDSEAIEEQRDAIEQQVDDKRRVSEQDLLRPIALFMAVYQVEIAEHTEQDKRDRETQVIGPEFLHRIRP